MLNTAISPIIKEMIVNTVKNPTVTKILTEKAFRLYHF